MIQTQYNGRKSNFGSDLGPLGPNSGRQNFVSKIWLHQSLENMVSYHQVKYLKKLMIHSLRKFSDGRTEGRTDGQTDRQTRVISQDAVRLRSSV